MHMTAFRMAIGVLLVCLSCATHQPRATDSPALTRVYIPAADDRFWMISWDATAPHPEGSIWLAYLMRRATYLQDHSSANHALGVITPEFDEEVYARTETANTYRRLQEGDPQFNIPYFDDLSFVVESGFIREYCWHYLRRPAWVQPTDLRLAEFEIWKSKRLSHHQPRTSGTVSLVVK